MIRKGRVPLVARQEAAVLKRSVFDFGIEKLQDQSSQNPSSDVQTYKKSFTQSFTSKRTRSSNRYTSQGRYTGYTSYRAPSETETNRLWPFNEEHQIQTEREMDRSRETGFKNIDTLLIQDSRRNRMHARQRSELVIQGKHHLHGDQTWEKLPPEFKKMPLFQAIYLKEKSKHLVNEEGFVDFKTQLKGMDMGEGNHPQVLSHRSQRPVFEPKQSFYGLSTIDYQNYKYRKVPTRSSSTRKPLPQQRQSDLKVPLEHYVQNIQTQKRILNSIHMNNAEPPHETLRREFNSRLNRQLPLVNTEASANLQQSEDRQMMSGDIINELEQHSGVDIDQKVRIKNQKAPLSFRIKSDRTLGIDISDRTDEGSQKVVLSNRRNSRGDKEISRLTQWKEEFEKSCALSQAWLAQYKAALLKEEGDEVASKIYSLNTTTKENGICLKIFVESQEIFRNQKKTIIDRVLLALGMNPSVEVSMINWNKFLEFKRILIAKDAALSESIEFMIKFFKVDKTEEIKREKFVLILKSLIENVQMSNKRILDGLNSSYQVLTENYKLNGVLRDGSDFVDFGKFKEVYLSKKMNILDLIDLISILN